MRDRFKSMLRIERYSPTASDILASPKLYCTFSTVVGGTPAPSSKQTSQKKGLAKASPLSVYMIVFGEKLLVRAKSSL